MTAATCPVGQVGVSLAGCLGKELYQKSSTLQYGEAWQRKCGGGYKLFWKPARDAITSSENPFLRLTTVVIKMNPLLRPWSCAPALVINAHYILSFSQQTWTADCSLPLCSTLPCISIILRFLFNIFSWSSNQVVYFFPWRPRNH